MSGSCKCRNAPHDPPRDKRDPDNSIFSPDLEHWRTFGIKQDNGRVRGAISDVDLHPTHRYFHLLEHGFVPGRLPGPNGTWHAKVDAEGRQVGKWTPHDWSVEKMLTWDQAAGYIGDPWLDWVSIPDGERCVESRYKWCPSCKGVVAVPLGCHLKTCPRCWTTWAIAESHSITAKIAYARRIAATKGRPWHIMIRPPRGTLGFTWKELAAFRAKCYKIAAEHGVRGGVAVVHWGPDKDPARPWAPHIHIIGYLSGRYRPGPTKEGWTIKFVKIGGKDGLWKNVQKVAFYELTHAIRPPSSGHAATWFGFMANNKMKTPNPEMVAAMGLEPSEGPHCPACATKLVNLDIWDYTDPLSPEYAGSRLDGLDRPPPIILGPPDTDGKPRVLEFNEWDDFYNHCYGPDAS